MLVHMNEDRDLRPDVPETGSSEPSESKPPARRGPPPNPLYHPLFLPILLVPYCLWFGWDAFFSPPDYEHKTFNQIMFGITALACVKFVPQGIREFREDRAKAAEKQNTGSSD